MCHSFTADGVASLREGHMTAYLEARKPVVTYKNGEFAWPGDEYGRKHESDARSKQRYRCKQQSTWTQHQSQPMWKQCRCNGQLTKNQHAVPSAHCETKPSVKFRDSFSGRGYASLLHPEEFTQELPSVTSVDRCTICPGDILRVQTPDAKWELGENALRPCFS